MDTIWLGIIIVVCFCIWKFIVQPLMNENKPIEPEEGEGLNPLGSFDPLQPMD